MIQPRIIPCLLLQDHNLVKTIQFQNPRYIGDPVNTVKLFNEKEVDELIFLDITISKKRKIPSDYQKNDINYEIIKHIAQECMMPLTYGGGISSMESIQRLYSTGIEKVVINSYASDHPSFVQEASDDFGSQSIVVSIDVKRTSDNQYAVYSHCGTREIKNMPPERYAQQMERMGAGEIFINSIDRDGTRTGYDIELIKRITNSVKIPVIACGGAGTLSDFREAILSGKASAVAAGSFFVFHGKKQAVLITYPSKEELSSLFN